MTRHRRRHGFREPKTFFVIATEGSRTEEIYFEALKPPRSSQIQIKILPSSGGDNDPLKVLKRLKAYASKNALTPQDELWLVVDRDRRQEEDLKKVSDWTAHSKNRGLTVSNPCFELWLVLHFRDCTAHAPAALQNILKSELEAYSKSEYDARALHPNVDEAIERAERMDGAPADPWPRQPGTRVYQLVKRLIQT